MPVTEGVPLSPNGQQQQHAEPPVEPPLRPAGADVTQAAREPRLDFLFRSRQGTRASPPQQQEAFDALWPKRPGPEPQLDAERKFEPRVEPKLEPAPGVEEGHAGPSATVVDEPAVAEPMQHAPPPPTPAPTPTAETIQRTVAILKSGVVDGMAYTLYADGSIEAQLPQGTVRFGSIAELRAHIENNS